MQRSQEVDMQSELINIQAKELLARVGELEHREPEPAVPEEEPFNNSVLSTANDMMKLCIGI